MEVIASPTIEHVTVVTEAGWLNPVVTIAGVLVTALVTWLISNRNLKAAEERAGTEQSRHETEIARLRDESDKAEERHTQQIEVMLKQGRREREVMFLRELSDHLLAFATLVKSGHVRPDGPDALRLRQYGLKVHADFSEDDDAFAQNLAGFLEDLAERSEKNAPEPNPFGEDVNWGALLNIAKDAEKGAFYLLRWLHPGLMLDVSKAFERYRMNGTFDDLPSTKDV